MKVVSAVIFLLIFTNSVFCQQSDLQKIAQIDSLVALIPDGSWSGSPYKNIQASGPIRKKRLKIFNKTIGGFHELIVYKDKEVKMIRVYKVKKNSSESSSYYYDEGKLIRFDSKKEELNKRREVLSDTMFSVYFDSDLLVFNKPIDHIDVEAILKASENQINRWQKFIKEKNY